MKERKFPDLSREELAKLLKQADRKYHYSEIEKGIIVNLLGYCHAVDVRWTLRQMFEVYFKCSAMPGKEITVSDCNDKCEKCGCSTCTAANDAECLIFREKPLHETYLENELWFEDEIHAVLRKYKGSMDGTLDRDEITFLSKRIQNELDLLEGNITEEEFAKNINNNDWRI